MENKLTCTHLENGLCDKCRDLLSKEPNKYNHPDLKCFRCNKQIAECRCSPLNFHPQANRISDLISKSFLLTELKKTENRPVKERMEALVEYLKK